MLAGSLLLGLLFVQGVGSPKSWTPNERVLPQRVCDGNPNTYELLHTGLNQDPADFGLEWKTPTKISTVRFGFASLGGRTYEPDAGLSTLEFKSKGIWKSLRTELTLDTTHDKDLAQVAGRGTVWWTFRFEQTLVEAVRLRALSSAHSDPGYQCIALEEIESSLDSRAFVPGRVNEIGSRSANPGWLMAGANLAAPDSGATISRGVLTEVRWGKPVILNSVHAVVAGNELAIEFLAGKDWRPVSKTPHSNTNTYPFLPVSTRAVRVHTLQPLTVHLDDEARRYFESVKNSRVDVLGERFRHSQVRDLAEMESYLSPLNFSKAAIGRPGDLHETMSMWTGTFLMVENSAGMDSQTGLKLPSQDLDRWFAPCATKQRLGGDWMRTHSRYLDGWLPATVTEMEEGSLAYRQTLFVTAPGQTNYGNISIVEVTNRAAQITSGHFSYAMGLRPIYANNWTPFSQDPLPTDYRLDSDKKVVRNLRGEIVLQAFEPGIWSGTAKENHLGYDFTLNPGQTRLLCFYLPNVDAPIRKPAVIDAKKELEAFKSWWNNLLKKGATLDVPEQPINDLYRNLIAQALIITLDGNLVRYGAYQYEAYFGVEEGWPAVALAQYGFAEPAKRISELMLAPEQMDKGNYHHQYRNGLDPWYAITIAKLTGDMNWLQTLEPTLRSCAEWTIKVTHDNLDPKYGGTLPKHIYGGDIAMPAYSLYSNATCWRGLHDTAEALEMLDRAFKREESPDVSRYREEAEKYRKRILELADSLVDKSNGENFLPMSFDLETPFGHKDKEPSYPFLATHTTSGDIWGYVGNYWNLFAPLLLEVHLFDIGDKRQSWIPKTIETHGGLITGLARFDLGLDHIYGKGYIESLLQQGRREDFQSAFYGLLANGMSRNLFSSPEVSGVFPLRTDNLTQYREHEREQWNWFYRFMGPWVAGWQNQEGEPLSAGAGMALQILRMALVREDDRQDPAVGLRLLDGAPAHWFEDGKHVAVKGMRTFFGKVAFRVESHGGNYKAWIKAPNVPFTIYLPHSKGLELKEVRVNGILCKTFSANEISIKEHSVEAIIDARFG